jgi:hypothetical protein
VNTAALTLVLASCATNVQQYAQIDLSERSITVPPGGSGLTGAIKNRLSASGWRMVVDAGPIMTKGTVGDSKVQLATSDTFNSRYRLALRWEQFDLCLNFQPLLRFDISVIDNKTGAEVMTMSGNDCQSTIADQFIAQLK